MWGTCDRCQQRITNEATVVQLQHGELVRLSDGMPRLNPLAPPSTTPSAAPCGTEIAAMVQQLMDPAAQDQRTA